MHHTYIYVFICVQAGSVEVQLLILAWWSEDNLDPRGSKSIFYLAMYGILLFTEIFGAYSRQVVCAYSILCSGRNSYTCTLVYGHSWQIHTHAHLYMRHVHLHLYIWRGTLTYTHAHVYWTLIHTLVCIYIYTCTWSAYTSIMDNLYPHGSTYANPPH